MAIISRREIKESRYVQTSLMMYGNFNDFIVTIACTWWQNFFGGSNCLITFVVQKLCYFDWLEIKLLSQCENVKERKDNRSST